MLQRGRVRPRLFRHQGESDRQMAEASVFVQDGGRESGAVRQHRRGRRRQLRIPGAGGRAWFLRHRRGQPDALPRVAERRGRGEHRPEGVPGHAERGEHEGERGPVQVAGLLAQGVAGRHLLRQNVRGLHEVLP